MKVLKKGIFCAVLFSILAIFNIACLAGEAPNETYPATPDKVVKEFVEMDFEGMRIGWGRGGFEDHSEYVLWDDEPGWDGCSIISGYDIKTLQSGSDTARISVTYHVLGEFTGPYKWKSGRKKRAIVYLLKKDGGRWRIAEPMTSPHVSIDTIIKDLERITKEVLSI